MDILSDIISCDNKYGSKSKVWVEVKGLDLWFFCFLLLSFALLYFLLLHQAVIDLCRTTPLNLIIIIIIIIIFIIIIFIIIIIVFVMLLELLLLLSFLELLLCRLFLSLLLLLMFLHIVNIVFYHCCFLTKELPFVYRLYVI